MAERKANGRMQQKSDTSANWTQAATFVPLKGEVIYYSDLDKIKIGDGTTTVGNLSFVKGRPDSYVEARTLEATGWSSNTYSFESIYPSSTYNIQVELAPTATVAQYKAFGKAGITGNASTNVLTAINVVPTITIPVLVTVEAK